jgi:DNA-directed RNA polymerase specialized sigma24 family protein
VPVGDEQALFRELHPRLGDHVRLLVRTSQANVEDACSFAFLQLLRYQPDRDNAYAWLLRTATREAIKSDQRARRTIALRTCDDDDRVAEPADERTRPEHRVELLAALDIENLDARDPDRRPIAILCELELELELADRR